MRSKDKLDIQEAREELKLTRVQLAEKLGVERHTITRWENLEGRPSLLARREINRLLRKHRK